MIPSHLLGTYHLQRSSRDGSPELRAYLRSEWNAEPAWVYASLERPKPPLLPRVVGWLRRLRHRASERRVRHEPTVLPASELEVDTEAHGADCPHSALEDLGVDGLAVYTRCAMCGAVLISMGDRRWAIGPARAIASNERVEPSSLPHGGDADIGPIASVVPPGRSAQEAHGVVTPKREGTPVLVSDG